MSGLTYHGPGDRLDQHNTDPNAHGGAFMTVGSVQGPRFIAPPASVVSAASTVVWPAANFAIFERFHVPIAKAYRYINFYTGVSSGNIQVGVASLALNSATSVNLTRVMNSGVIPCPTAGSPSRIDCGETTLSAGEYALFLWCDNTTATFMHSLATGFQASRLTFDSSVSGGVGSGVLTASVSTRWVSGLTLEASS